MTEQTQLNANDTKGSRLVVSRGVDGATAEGVVLLRRASEGDSPHARLAGARAWAQLGARRLETGDFEAAISCAESGLRELGRDYRPEGVKDSTALKIAAAHERVQQGYASDGARVLLDMLGIRATLYVTNYTDEILE